MQTAALVGEYLTYCKYLGLAEKTITQYRWALNRLIKHCSELPSDGFDLLPVIGDGSLGATSRRDLLKCLKSFFGWAQRRHKWPNPCVGLTLTRQRNQTRRVLTKNEIDRLFSVATSIRDRALLLVVLDCGLRVAEVANLRRGDLRDGWLVVTGKTGERLLPVSGELANLLTTLGEGDRLWIGRQGALTREGIMLIYRRLFALAGITGPKTGPHTLRHTFGTFYIRAGGGIRQLQQIMGHSQIETTMIYVHLAGNDVLADHAVYSPARQLGLVGLDRPVASTPSNAVATFPHVPAVPQRLHHSQRERSERPPPSTRTNTLHCRIPFELRRQLGYLMADDDTGLTIQIVQAVKEYVGNRTGVGFQTTLRAVRASGTAEFTCKIPAELHDQLHHLMASDGTGLAFQVVRAVREYVGRRGC